MDSLRKHSERAKRAITGEPEPEPTLAEEVNEMCSLSYKSRLIGFGVCCAIGLLLWFISLLSFGVIIAHPENFAFMYTMGNLVSLGGTCFLIGPMRQIKNMFKATRWIAASVYILTMILTFVAAFVVKNALMCIACVIVQAIALLWYSLSYIPFARRIVAKGLQSCCGEMCV